ncbi:MAG: DUF3791 domain-containing protein [Bacteroidales bacterium]|nr:DUF3791 domain-containing protein [Bacteroidales bacterium]
MLVHIRLLNKTESFLYLDRYKGFDYLLEFYPSLHLQSVDDTVDELHKICRKNGGCL